jgi:hypothetical protein
MLNSGSNGARLAGSNGARLAGSNGGRLAGSNGTRGASKLDEDDDPMLLLALGTRGASKLDEDDDPKGLVNGTVGFKVKLERAPGADSEVGSDPGIDKYRDDAAYGWYLLVCLTACRLNVSDTRLASFLVAFGIA